MTDTNDSTSRRAALIAGGSGDIGRAIAAHLIDLGYSVALLARSEDRLDAARKELEASGGRVTTLACDIGDETAVGEAVKKANDTLGRIDVAVNAAGIAEPAFVARADSAYWERMVRTNVLGAVWIAKAVGPIMRRQKGGHIINIGSWASEEGRAGMAAYSATKGALASLARGVLREVGRKGVKVSTISPEEVATSMHPDDSPDRAQMILPDDVAEAVGFLLRLSPNASIPELFLRRTDALV